MQPAGSPAPTATCCRQHWRQPNGFIAAAAALGGGFQAVSSAVLCPCQGAQLENDLMPSVALDKFPPRATRLCWEPGVVTPSQLFRDRQESVGDHRRQGNACIAQPLVCWQGVSFKEEAMKWFGRKLEWYLARGNWRNEQCIELAWRFDGASQSLGDE